ncbi:hypothetical protein CEXT_423431 [Caerostris extrusa]|uniref:Uncharacterized protein n=1 Tax=Caerostris extrusa TaxID=172846 RepID=A0AAV4V4L7_CAEEX|nr:hypothetical protein CEXT_423431 [Caerostris extrusa]
MINRGDEGCSYWSRIEDLYCPQCESDSLWQLTRVIIRGEDDFSYWAKNKVRPGHSGRVAERDLDRVAAGHVHFYSGYERLRKLHFHLTKCYYPANSDGVVLIV